jgi:hypothetical protein
LEAGNQRIFAFSASIDAEFGERLLEPKELRQYVRIDRCGSFRSRLRGQRILGWFELAAECTCDFVHFNYPARVFWSVDSNFGP